MLRNLSPEATISDIGKTKSHKNLSHLIFFSNKQIYSYIHIFCKQSQFPIDKFVYTCLKDKNNKCTNFFYLHSALTFNNPFLEENPNGRADDVLSLLKRFKLKFLAEERPRLFLFVAMAAPEWPVLDLGRLPFGFPSESALVTVGCLEEA